MSARVLERLTRTALLGVRPWDFATGRAVTDGLSLTDVRHGVQARANGSGVFAFHDLPSLHDSAFAAGDQAFWDSPPASGDFTLELSDHQLRFLTFRFDARAPARGLFREDCGPTASPPELDVPGVPLFSAPSRPVPPGMAAVSADLWDLDADAPAAWAVLELTPPGGPTTRGVADGRGCVLVPLAYPEPPWQDSSPPPGARSLSEQTWPLELAVRYEPAGAGPPLPDPASGVAPDLCAVLAQGHATALAAVSPMSPLTAATLAFGRRLTLRTPGHSVLFVTPP